MTPGRAAVVFITLALTLPVSTTAQPPGRFPLAPESVEPPLAGQDTGVQQASGQIPAYSQRPAVPTVIVTPQVPQYVPHGKDIEYKLRVQNVATLAASKVEVIHILPKGATIIKADPKPTAERGDEVVWSLETMAGGAVKDIAITARPPATMTEWVTVAHVRYQHGLQAKTRIAKPELTLKYVGPTQVQQFDTVPARLELINPGLLEVRDVTVSATLPEGVTHEYGPPVLGQPADAKNDPRTRTWTVPRLGPNEMRAFDFRVVASRAGAANPVLNAKAATGAETAAEPKIMVVAPKIEMHIAGPTKRGAHQSATYKITVRNAGSFPLPNVVVSDKLPANVDLVAASPGNQILEREVQWILPLLNPGESRVLELTTKATAANKATHALAAAYNAFRLPKEITTDFEATAALQLDVRGSPDGVNVGDTIRYTITVENTGSAEAGNVRPVLTLPTAVTFATADLTHRVDGQRVQFDPIKLAPGGKQVYTVTAKAAKAILPAVVSVDLFADTLEAGPLHRQDSTAISNPTGK